MANESKLRLFFPCFFSFFVNGAMVLMVGAILPNIIEEAGISYGAAGGLLSCFAIGNLLASFVNPVMASAIGRKPTIVIMTAFIPLMWVVLVLLPPLWVMYLAIIIMGMGRGSVSIINNAIVNDNTGGNTSMLNLLHMTFAVGAFLSPYMLAVLIDNGLGWRMGVYVIIAATCLSCLFYLLMKIDYNWPKESVKGKNNDECTLSGSEKAYLRNEVFYINGFLLFLYLGLENCVNGWFVTYFKNMGIMSVAYSAKLVSVTWLMVMIGRLITSKIAKKIKKNILILLYCVATLGFFSMMIATQDLKIITVAIAGLGLFFSGIYPTCVASVGNIIRGNHTAMSLFLAIAALGGIITPQIVGIVADYAGLGGAIMLLYINGVGMLLFAFLNLKKNKQ